MLHLLQVLMDTAALWRRGQVDVRKGLRQMLESCSQPEQFRRRVEYVDPSLNTRVRGQALLFEHNIHRFSSSLGQLPVMIFVAECMASDEMLLLRRFLETLGSRVELVHIQCAVLYHSTQWRI